MKVLAACEVFQEVASAFRARGHEAWSCDIEPCAGDHPDWHMQCDVRDVLHDDWDMILAFPPCTHLCVSGARHFAAKRADGRQQQGIDFFMLFTNHPCPMVAIENPVGIMSSQWRQPDQIIQPWQFGHPHSKATCLWLKGLPTLQPTNILPRPTSGRWENQTPSGQNKLGPSETRAAERGRTYRGIAKAMAQQWTRI